MNCTQGVANISGTFVELSEDEVGSAVVMGSFGGSLDFLLEVALEFELGGALGLVDDDLGHQGVVIIVPVLSIGVDDLV